MVTKTTTSITDKVIYGPRESYRNTESISSLFLETATKQGNKLAISFGDQELTYSDLRLEAGKIHYLLRSQGIRKGDFVGVYMERSLETVISILGVLFAGGVYVPIDPEHPQERNKHVITNSDCKYLLVKEQDISKAESLLSGVNTATIIPIEGPDEELVLIPEAENIHPDDLAYVIYTSGSTGLPKGAMLSHRGVVNLCNTISNTLDLTEEDVVTQFSTFSFDASVFDTFNALLKGAHLAMLTKEEQLNPEALVSMVERRKATFLFCLPTSVFNRLSESVPAANAHQLSSIKVVLVAGEALLSDYVRKFQDKFGSKAVIVNAYGPTECTVCATMYPIKSYWTSESVTVPIGYPIGNYTLYVVKEDGTLAGVGEEGELYIETVGISKGYLKLEEKTAESFIPNPFRNNNALVYKSGDIVKVLDEGGLEFQYRKDGQLKLRGFRIEIGEIENALSKHEGILDAVVVPIKDGSIVKYLSCYYSEKHSTSIGEIKSHLKNYVPSYMIPSYFYVLDEIPLTPTGKVDRKKLIAMDDPDSSEQEATFENAISETEIMLAGIWSEVLNVSAISRNSNFFNIGGDSLAVIQVLSHLKLDYLDLKINDLYQYNTLKDLAWYIESLEETVVEEEVEISSYYELTELPKFKSVTVSGRDGLGSNVLVTGATGYLGSHIAYEILTGSDKSVYLLVRPKNEMTAWGRIDDVFNGYFGDGCLDPYRHRISLVEGDISQTHLGLDASELISLTASITSIIHAAADVRHFGSAEGFQSVNVEGTRNLLNLVGINRNITFHFISTVAVPEELAVKGLWTENCQFPNSFYDNRSANVYTDSKLSAEKLVATAIVNGLPCSIYRAGNLSCDSTTGRFQSNINENFFYRMLKGFLLLGKIPAVNTYVDITPIDFASKFVVELAKSPRLGEVYHICNPNQAHFSLVVSYLLLEGYELELVSVKAFRDWVLSEGNAVSEEGVQLVMAYLDGDGLYASDFKFSSSESFGKTEFIKTPPETRVLITRMVDYARSIGYFPK